MGWSDDYKRGYSKGYNTGMATGTRRAEKAEAAQMLAEQSVAAMQERNGAVGRCQDCAHWRRGVDEDGRAWVGMEWGTCAASLDHRWPWFHSGAGGKPLSTCKEFGCLRFSPRLTPPEGSS